MSPPRVDLRDVLPEISAHLEAAWPNEGCGLVLRAPDGRLRVRPMRNVQDDLHAADPVAHPHTARTAYAFDEREHLLVLLEADSRGEAVECLFHSHPEGDATFSTTDRARAAPGGVPLFPLLSWLVVAVIGRRANVARLYRWTGEGFEFADLQSRVAGIAPHVPHLSTG